MRKDLLKITAILLLALVAQQKAIAQQVLPPYGSAGKQVGVSVDLNNGFDFGYFEYLPNDYVKDAGRKYPVIIFFHGLGEKGNATYSETSGTYSVDTGLKKILRKPKRTNGALQLNEKGEIQYYLRKDDPPSMINASVRQFPAIVISPQSRRGDGQFTPADFELIFEFITTNYPVDINRIYITGLSAGGGSAWKALRSKYADQIAAAVPICGAGSVANPSDHLQQTAIWTHHNFNDGTVGKGNTISNVNRIANNEASVMDVYPYNSGASAADSDKTMHFNVSNQSWTIDDGVNAPRQKMAFTLYPSGGHNAWVKTYQNQAVWDWLFMQSLEGTSTGHINKPPVANAGGNQNVAISIATLDGSKSTDDQGITSFQWEQLSGKSVNIINPNSSSTEVASLSAGDYSFVLKVQDVEGLMDVDTIQIKYTNQSNYLTVKANDPAGDRIYLFHDGDRSNSNQIEMGYPENKTLSFAIKKKETSTFNWDRLLIGMTVGYQSQEIPMIDLVTEVGTEWVYVSIPIEAFKHDFDKLMNNGISNVYFLARSNFGKGDFYIDEISIRGGQAPILWYGNDYSLSGEASSVEQTSLNFTISPMIDQPGYTVSSLTSTNQYPLAKAGPDQQLTVDFATLDGSRSVDDAGEMVYQWSQVEGALVAIKNPNQAVATVSGMAEGIYTFELTVTDLEGLIDTDKMTIVVSPLVTNNEGLQINVDYPAGERIFMYYDTEKSNGNEQNIDYPNNHSLSFNIRANNSSDIKWENLLVGLTVGYQSEEKPITDYVDSFVAGEWQTVTIPLSSLGHDLNKWENRGVSRFTLLAKSGLGKGYFEIDEITFVGGATPFIWFGDSYEVSGTLAAVEMTAQNFTIELLASFRSTSDQADMATSKYENTVFFSNTTTTTTSAAIKAMRQVKLYPNPNNGQFIVEVTESKYPIQMSIYNAHGNLIKSQSFKSKVQVNLSAQPAGLYSIYLVDASGQTDIKKVQIE